jgi:glutamate-5-semialdehyde dehydrogenase
MPSKNINTLSPEVEKSLQELKLSTTALRKLNSQKKDSLLIALAQNLVVATDEILTENTKDIARLAATTKPSFKDRLTLNQNRISALAESLRQVSALPDPVHELVEEKTLDNGLHLKKVRSPLGLIFMIFESRPNVILEAFSLAFKSGNAILLRGGSESEFTNKVLYKIMTSTLRAQGFDFTPFYGLEDYDRKWVEVLLTRKELIDVVVPRGGDKLIQMVQEKSLMPIIKNDRGLCHAYVDEDADLDMAVKIVANAKIQRPGVCNSLETVLVHKNIAAIFLPKLYTHCIPFHLEWRVDAESISLLPGQQAAIQPASIEDWDTEHLDLILNCKVVGGITEALEHIRIHGSKHSEAIITSSEKKARQFQDEVDAAATYWNASTRFTDGFEFGLGGELGISTQKLHVRGPVGLRELTTPRWIIDGTGQIRN